MVTTIASEPILGIAAVYHFIDVFKNSVPNRKARKSGKKGHRVKVIFEDVL